MRALRDVDQRRRVDVTGERADADAQPVPTVLGGDDADIEATVVEAGIGEGPDATHDRAGVADQDARGVALEPGLAVHADLGRRSVGVYFELWLLKIAGYLPDWSQCHLCRNTLDHSDELSLAQDFHLSCMNCNRRRSPYTVTGRERELAAIAQKLSPVEFFSASNDRGDELNRLSATLKRMISQAIGREVLAR